MKTAMNQFTKKIKNPGLFILVLVMLQSCAKYKEFEAIFPAADDSLASYSKIVIDKGGRDDHLHQMLENALKSQLTSLHAGNIKPAKNIRQIENEISLFNYNPKIDSLPKTKIATLGFSIKANESIRRDRHVSSVILKKCNYLKKGFPCYPIGTGSLAKGKQTVNIKLTGSITLKNSQGRPIVAEFPINRSLKDSGRLVKSTGLLLHNGINQIAYEFTKKIVPHHESIKSEILRGGDSLAVKMIENNALNLAVNRLDKIVGESSEPEVEDVYNLGLAYEVLSEVQQALVYYEKAQDIDPGNKTVKIALKRVRRIVKD